ncbi:prepilin peptidase [Pseudomonas sp. PDM26]|uniref:A24 family peptidase n=1 Tax=Pseudomonas sp. PDM26 TaxID=2854766 RepID=UPI001C4670BE|nr:prepilin peptidase [Pseudomonas sp. PDM26]MBV7545223.1 prepilin peptidase [Pseudomonas sp. PDM26]
MPIEQMFTSIVLLGLLGIAVVSDLRRHRIPNLLVFLGLVLGLTSQAYASGVEGLGNAALAMLIGFAVFLPMYALGGMAAGDVKLMAMVGCFFTPYDALWTALFSLTAGGLCGVLIILFRGQLLQTLARYWLILGARTYLAPAEDEVAGKPFPYSVAILLGTLASGYWLQIGP